MSVISDAFEHEIQNESGIYLIYDYDRRWILDRYTNWVFSS